jgi:hypothetical protein
MPLQVEINQGFKKFCEPRIILPGFFGFMKDFSSGEAEILGLYCHSEDAGMAVMRFREGVEYDGESVTFSTSSEFINQGVIIAQLEENTVYTDELLDCQDQRILVSAYHIGGLAAFYCGREN